ncbi:MAG: NAD+ kinase [Archangium sp.]|nr:NAD+ kinase [Archangium sp.]MDP3153128.1 NAD+ kinase [Archangium sp.]MDP3572261.1 NAD+ kinase [Archangium sp.]
MEKLILITRKTRLEALTERFNTQAQAKFYLTQAGLDFDDYAKEHDHYRRALEKTQQAMQLGMPIQTLERSLVPTYLFAPSDVVVVLGQDGTVANTAKYIGHCPLLGVNPDPERFDGVLLPFRVDGLRRGLETTLAKKAVVKEVTLAEAVLSDGQKLLAFNDLFIGARTHVSAHYRLTVKNGPAKGKTREAGPRGERQSSSGIIVSTGAGSTGWLSSVCNMASGMSRQLGGSALEPIHLEWDARQLYFVVREPFISKSSGATYTAGYINEGAPLELESLMPSGGVIFSDGMEDDALSFTSGLVARIGPSQQRARLVMN